MKKVSWGADVYLARTTVCTSKNRSFPDGIKRNKIRVVYDSGFYAAGRVRLVSSINFVRIPMFYTYNTVCVCASDNNTTTVTRRVTRHLVYTECIYNRYPKPLF